MLGYAWNEADRLAVQFEHEIPQEVEDRIFLAGEATAPVYYGTAHGAWMEGERAADAALKAQGLATLGLDPRRDDGDSEA